MNELNKYTLETPCFLVNKQGLDNNLHVILQAIKSHWKDPIVGYSFKTNSLPWLLSYLKTHGLYAEVVSPTEYDLALRIGYPPEKIIYNGPIKDEESFINAIKTGSIVNIDSKKEIEYLQNYDSLFKRVYSIGIRVNVDLEDFCPGQTIMGKKGGRFGFNEDTGELKECIDTILELKNLRINCLHLHTNSRTRSLDVFSAIAEYSCRIIKNYNLEIQYLDIGGGFFGGPDASFSFDDYCQTIKSVLEIHDLNNVQLIIEPGSSIIASPIEYICSVWDIKKTNYGNFIVLDGSRTNIDPMKHKEEYKYSLISEFADNQSIADKQVLVGSTCMEDDRFMTLHQEKQLGIGDMVIFKQVGSYTMALSPLFINYYPNVYLNDYEHFQLIRDKWGNEEFLQKSYDIFR